MSDWNPTQYLRFEAERTRPSIDLAARIEIEAPASIVDIGCGPGNSARVLRERWPRSPILGLDNSPAMIEKAKKDHPELSWKVADASVFDEPGAYDIVFSNAALQWIPDHAGLVPRLFRALRAGGALAVQIPQFPAMPICAAIDEVAASARWRAHTRDCAAVFTYHDAGYYYDLLAPLSTRIDLWRSLYYHRLPDHRALVDFIRSTGLKPYLDALPGEEERTEFELSILGRVEEAYPACADGKVLFPFDRLFFIAYR
jgi:trans-aconitate 2-methyltransferase